MIIWGFQSEIYTIGCDQLSFFFFLLEALNQVCNVGHVGAAYPTQLWFSHVTYLVSIIVVQCSSCTVSKLSLLWISHIAVCPRNLESFYKVSKNFLDGHIIVGVHYICPIFVVVGIKIEPSWFSHITVCPRSLEPFYRVSYYVKDFLDISYWVTIIFVQFLPWFSIKIEHIII